MEFPFSVSIGGNHEYVVFNKNCYLGENLN